jgi:hypothetical protein
MGLVARARAAVGQECAFFVPGHQAWRGDAIGGDDQSQSRGAGMG